MSNDLGEPPSDVDVNGASSGPAKTTVIALTIAAMLVAGLVASNSLPWLQGRLNSQVSGLVLNLIGMAIMWPLLFGLLLFRSTGFLTPWRFGLAIVACLPWFILVIARPATSAYAHGFRGWAAANVDALAIRESLASVTPRTQPAPAPPTWPTREYEMPVGLSVSRTSLPASVASLRPDAVRILPDKQTIIVSWEGRLGAWVRFVIVGGADVEQPEEFRESNGIWQRVKPDVIVGVVYRH